ncbi:MAG: shikimate dehydrogenase [Verrucomicrobia bacterium]|nr:shikimate dehydrogenase [Verrucomicrobiota bacterium]
MLKDTSYGKARLGSTDPTAFLLGETPFRWLNVGVTKEVFTPDSLPPLTAGRSRYGVLGFPIAHSLSPFLHHAGFVALGLDAEYLRIEVPAADLASAISLLKKGGFRGWNCTLPHKNSMFSLVDRVEPTATEAKSVNTVRIEGDQSQGFSTDALGWRAAIKETWNIDLEKSRILILGCGGVGQTLARHLAKTGCRSLLLVNRDPTKAKKLEAELAPLATERFSLRSIGWHSKDLDHALKETDLLIQGTSLGLGKDDPLPIDPAKLARGTKLYDTVYRQELTPLVRAARKLGYQAEDGLGMLLHQGALSFTIWTGQTAPLEKMRHALFHAAQRLP